MTFCGSNQEWQLSPESSRAGLQGHFSDKAGGDLRNSWHRELMFVSTELKGIQLVFIQFS